MCKAGALWCVVALILVPCNVLAFRSLPFIPARARPLADLSSRGLPLRVRGGAVAARVQMTTGITADAMTPDEWFKVRVCMCMCKNYVSHSVHGDHTSTQQPNGYGQPTFSNLGGSGWAQQYKYTAGGSDFFVKTARQSAESMFKGEALGLMAMYHAGALRIPKVFHYGDDGRGGSYIIMEMLALGGPKDQTDFGRAMAKMHLAQPLATEAQQGMFGFDCDNTIGGTSQPNKWDDNWVRFFREQRIGHQVKLADDVLLERTWQKVHVCCH